MTTRHGTHRAATTRRGISLLEVLISIGILAVGLIAVLSLVPVGRSYLAKAAADDQAAAAIAAAYDTLDTAGLLGASSVGPLTGVTSRVAVVDPAVVTRLDMQLGGDPSLAAARQNLSMFKQAGGSTFQIPRLTWAVPGTTTPDQRVALADRLCRMQDDLEVDDNVVDTRGSGKRDEFAPPRPRYAVGPIGTTGQVGPLARQALGRLSWLVLLQPQAPGPFADNWTPGSVFDVSIAIFRDRPMLRTLADTPPSVTGEYVFTNASWDPTQGLLSITVPQTVDVHGQTVILEDEDLRFIFRTGGWILLAPLAPHIGLPATNNQRLGWIRIQTVEIGRSGSAPKVTILPNTEPPAEVLGTTAPTAPAAPVGVVALVYEGVIAVATKQITVQGP